MPLIDSDRLARYLKADMDWCERQVRQGDRSFIYGREALEAMARELVTWLDEDERVMFLDECGLLQ